MRRVEEKPMGWGVPNRTDGNYVSVWWSGRRNRAVVLYMRDKAMYRAEVRRKWEWETLPVLFPSAEAAQMASLKALRDGEK